MPKASGDRQPRWARRKERQAEAIVRNEECAKLTDSERLLVIASRRGESKKELQRILAKTATAEKEVKHVKKAV